MVMEYIMHQVYDLSSAIEDSFEQLKNKIDPQNLIMLIKWTKESSPDYEIMRALMLDEKMYFKQFLEVKKAEYEDKFGNKEA